MRAGTIRALRTWSNARAHHIMRSTDIFHIPPVFSVVRYRSRVIPAAARVPAVAGWGAGAPVLFTVS